jgi:hypothetical protein
MTKRNQLLVLSGGIALAFFNAAFAADVTYTLDPTASSLSVSGDLAGTPAQQQSAGSLITSYSGTIHADRGAGTIQFLSGSSLDAALQSQNQEPRSDGGSGAEPADYGRTAIGGTIAVQVVEALRDWNFGLESDNPINVTGSTFTGSDVGMAVASGESFWMYGTQSGDKDFSGLFAFNSASTPPTLSTSGSIETLTLPLRGQWGYGVQTTGDSSLVFSGTIVATRTVPEPGTMAAMAAAVVGLGLTRRRRALPADKDSRRRSVNGED